jgi:hypothetical protein
VIAKGTILVVVVSILLVGSWIQGNTGLVGDQDEIAELRKQVTLLEGRVNTLERRLEDDTAQNDTHPALRQALVPRERYESRQQG